MDSHDSRHRRPKPKPGGQKARPRSGHRLLVEVDVLCADDLGTAETLAGVLSRLAIGGLTGMVREVLRVELDGKEYGLGPEIRADVVRSLRPPPDRRVGVAYTLLTEALEALAAVYRSSADEETTEEFDQASRA